LQPGEDPFTLLRQEKRERVKHQQKQQLANVKQAVKESGAAAVPATLRLAAALPNKGKGKPTKRKELRDEVCLPFLCPFFTMTVVNMAAAAGWQKLSESVAVA
jgi:hypothetical protein